jgi:hypothetical protein
MSIQLYASKSNGNVSNLNKLAVANDATSICFLLRFTELDNCNNIKVALFDNKSTNCDISLIDLKTVLVYDEDLLLGEVYFSKIGRYDVDIYKQTSLTNLDVDIATYCYSTQLSIELTNVCNVSTGTGDFNCSELSSCDDFIDLVSDVNTNKIEINQLQADLTTHEGRLDALDDVVVDLFIVKENISNKTDVITGNETSSTLYASIKGVVDWLTGAKIRSILGVSTLSGANTGDETTGTIQTKRPIKTLVGTSLEGSGDTYIQLKPDDFFLKYNYAFPIASQNNINIGGFNLGVVASGTFGVSTTTNPITTFWGGSMARSSTTTQSGVLIKSGSFQSASDMQGTYFTSDRKLFSRTILSFWNNTSTELGFFGFADYTGQTTNGDLGAQTHGASCFRVSNNIISCVTLGVGGKTTNANTFTVTQSTIYVLDITGDATSVVFSIKDVTGAEVFTCTNTTNIPISAAEGFGYVCTMLSSATTAKDLFTLYETTVGTLNAYKKLGC